MAKRLNPASANHATNNALHRGTYTQGVIDGDIRHLAWRLWWGLAVARGRVDTRAAGHTVYRPTLTGLGERVHLASAAVDLQLHVLDMVNVLAYEDLRMSSSPDT